MDVIKHKRDVWRAIVLAALMVAAFPASAFLVPPSVPLEQLARSADLVCKVTVIADRPVADGGLEPISGLEVREAELRIVSIVKGVAPNVIRFRHYASTAGPFQYAPGGSTLFAGRSYLVLAAKVSGNTYRQSTTSRTIADQNVLLAADAKPHRGTTLSEAEWGELVALLGSPVEEDVIRAIQQLDLMSGGPSWDHYEVKDFERSRALTAILPLVGTQNAAIATAAITVFGRDSPYFEDEDAQFWFVGIGKGHIPGYVARKRPASPVAEVGEQALLRVADKGKTPQIRAIAIRALGRSSHAIPAAKVALWIRDPGIDVRRAAVLVSAELSDHEAIVRASRDGSPDIRQEAALAVGFAQDPRLLPVLDHLLRDSVDSVRNAAALSLVSFPIEQAAPVMKANLESDFRLVFVDALAQADPQPYLATLAEIIEGRLQPPDGWAGAAPVPDSWQILFGFVKSRPAAELLAGKFDRSLDALERLQWASSGEPNSLYALYVSRGLVSRAKRFREAARQSVPFDMEVSFDRVDKNPEVYLQ
jgi:hypothetical protein